MVPKKSQSTPQSSVTRKIYQEYRSAGNSSRVLAEKLGVSHRTANRWLAKMAEGQPVYKSEYYARVTADRIEHKADYFKGTKTMQEVYTQDVKGGRILDYKMRPGEKLPANIEARGTSFQILAKGSDGTWRTTQPAIDTNTAGMANSKMMSKYNSFHASEMFVRVFIEEEDLSDFIDYEADEFEDEYEE